MMYARGRRESSASRRNTDLPWGLPAVDIAGPREMESGVDRKAYQLCGLLVRKKERKLMQAG